MKAAPKSERERFLSMVSVRKNSGCWEWSGRRSFGGYGWFGARAAHRFAYASFVSEIPSGMSVLHRCDNPPCVNPDHLFIGTQLDNMRDRRDKGRDRKSRRATLPAELPPPTEPLTP